MTRDNAITNARFGERLGLSPIRYGSRVRRDFIHTHGERWLLRACYRRRINAARSARKDNRRRSEYAIDAHSFFRQLSLRLVAISQFSFRENTTITCNHGNCSHSKWPRFAGLTKMPSYEHGRSYIFCGEKFPSGRCCGSTLLNLSIGVGRRCGD